MALNNVPLNGQDLNFTKPLINQNFSLIDTAFSVNHVQYNDGSGNQGKHNLVTFTQQASAPSFLSGEEGIYNLPYNNTSSVVNELFVHKQTSIGTADIPFTASVISQGVPVAYGNGWTQLPSGIMFKWGSFVGLPGGAGTFNLAATLAPAYSNAVLSVQLTPFGFSTSPLNFNVRLVSIGTPPSQIVTYYISNGTNTGPAASGVGGFTYFAIGY